MSVEADPGALETRAGAALRRAGGVDGGDQVLALVV